jgi:hypothetical protein
MGPVVYALCSLTSMACAVLLIRGYMRTKVKLLFWSGLCFVGLALNNIILFFDLVLVPDKDLSLLRIAPAVVGMLLLVYGLITDTK